MVLMDRQETREETALAELLRDYSVEITSRSRKAIDVVADKLAPGTEVFVANLPTQTVDDLVDTAKRLKDAGFVPVPHIVARNIAGSAALEDMVARLTGEAGVDRALVLGGDRDDPAGEYDASLQLIESGVFRKHGIGRLAVACYPEGHPRITDRILSGALTDKLAAAADAGHDVLLVSQFLFEPQPIVDFARRLREDGVTAPLRVGVAGPSDRGTLVKFALRSGVGASLRALRERQDLARNVMGGETPDDLLGTVAEAQRKDPSLGISGAHFFTFGSPAKSIDWAESRRR